MCEREAISQVEQEKVDWMNDVKGRIKLLSDGSRGIMVTVIVSIQFIL